jgi:hypothetical protein
VVSNVLPGWPAGYDADLHRLRALEFTRVADTITAEFMST